MSAPASGAAAGAGAGAAAEPSNWLTEWRERTPLVTRWALMTVLPVSVASMLFGLGLATALIPYRATHDLELWRFVTSLFDQGGFFTLLFVLLVLATQMPAQEIRAGSVPFLLNLLSTGLLINVLFASLAMLLYLVPGETFLRYFAFTPSRGLWPVLMASIAVNSLADPAGQTRFICFSLPNRVYPWFLVAIFSLLAGFVLLDMLMGVAVGHLQHYGLLDLLKPTARAIASYETGAGWAVRLGMTSKQGFVYGRDTTIPVGARALDREAAEAQWAMFDPIARRRQQERQQQQQQQQQGQDGQGAQGGAAGDEEGGGRSFVFQAGRGRPSAGAGMSASSFSGAGHALGSTSSSSSAGAPASAPAPALAAAGGQQSVSALISGLFGRGPGPEAAASGSGRVVGGPVGGGGGGAAAEERRRAAAAAAEARLRATAARGLGADSPRAQVSASAPAAPAAAAAARSEGDLLELGLGGGRNPVTAPHSSGGGSGGGGVARPARDLERRPLIGGDDGEDEVGLDDVDLLYGPVTATNLSGGGGGTTAPSGARPALPKPATAPPRSASAASTPPPAPSAPAPSGLALAAQQHSAQALAAAASVRLKAVQEREAAKAREAAAARREAAAAEAPPSADLTSLIEMGFQRSQAASALAAAHGDFGRALEILTEE